MKRRLFLPFMLVILIALLFTSFRGGEKVLEYGGNIYQDIKKFVRVLDLVSAVYVEEVNTDELIDAAIEGALKELDPHSIYLPPKETERANEEFTGSFEGIGIRFEIVDGVLTVVAPIAGTPSEKLGILPGDQIIKIENKSTKGISNEEVIEKLRGPKGSMVHVTIHRPGISEALEFDITRDKIPIYSVNAKFMLDEKTGYLAFDRFAATTSDEVEEALQELEQQGMKQLILDLRGNAGGYLDQAVRVTDKFLKGGQMVVYTKGRTQDSNDEFKSLPKPSFRDYPLIVLIDRGSASASEILAGAVQDLDRGLVVGERSFGKGLVQRQFPLGDGSAFRVTTSRYFTPSGRLIQRPFNNQSVHDYYVEASTQEFEQDTTLIFRTKMGRTVFGGGGILPDYYVKNDTLTLYTANLRRKGVFSEFIATYTEQNGVTLRDKYAEKKNEFMTNYTVTDLMMQEFLKIAEAGEIEFNSKEYEIDKRFIETRLKAEVARYIWGLNEYYRVFRLEADSVVKKAVGLFPVAKEFSDFRMDKATWDKVANEWKNQ